MIMSSCLPRKDSTRDVIVLTLSVMVNHRALIADAIFIYEAKYW